MELKPLHEQWLKTGRNFVYWDRGYLCRGGRTWLKAPHKTEYFRWHVNAYQMKGIRPDAVAERFDRLKIRPDPWNRRGTKIVVAEPSAHYAKFHNVEDWVVKIVAKLKKTGRPIKVRNKLSRIPLQRELHDAYCLVTHGSVAAVEAVVFGCPVITDPCSTAAPMGRTAIEDIDNLVYPDRAAWLSSVATSQFSAGEIVSGEIWDLIA
jgi:hypothetical protein